MDDNKKHRVTVDIKSGNKNLTLVLKTHDRLSQRKNKNEDLKHAIENERLPKVKSTIYS